MISHGIALYTHSTVKPCKTVQNQCNSFNIDLNQIYSVKLSKKKLYTPTGSPRRRGRSIAWCQSLLIKTKNQSNPVKFNSKI